MKPQRRLLSRWLPLQMQLFLMGVMPVVPVLLLFWADRSFGPFSRDFLILAAAILGMVLVFHYYTLWRMCSNPFRALAGFVHSLHQGDYSQRVMASPAWDALGNLNDELNRLADVLQDNRFAAVESTRRFQYLIDQLDVCVVAFDENQRLCWANTAFSRLCNSTPTQLKGSSINELYLVPLWTGESGRTLWLSFADKSSRFLMHTKSFRDEGRPQRLFLLTDVKSPLREEERTAWRRLIRVLGHELNNSLTPITSLAQSLRKRVDRLDMPVDWKESSAEALDIIIRRAHSMNRFVADYSRLAKLPEPVRESVPVSALIRRAVHLQANAALHIIDGPVCNATVDPGQIEQLLLNVLRNALEAIPAETGHVAITWARDSSDAVIVIDDNGSGIEHLENLFVPFFSTKTSGSGIGLVLCQQIAEANGGSIQLANRNEGGCRVSIRLPIL